MFALRGVVNIKWSVNLGVCGGERDELAHKQVQDTVKGRGGVI